MLTIDDLCKTMEEIRRTPVIVGIAAHPQLVRRIALAVEDGAPRLFQDAPAVAFFGTPLVEDHSMPPGVAWVFHDRDVWRLYAEHREAQRLLRQNAPFRFEAYVERGLVMQADIRSLIDRS